MEKKKNLLLFTKRYAAPLVFTLLIPATVNAQYYGTGTRKREEIVIDFNADHLKEAEEEEKKKEESLSKHPGIPAELVAQCESELGKPEVDIALINNQGHVLYSDKGLLELSGNSRFNKKGSEVIYTFSKTHAENTYRYAIDADAVHGDNFSCLSPRVSITLTQAKQETEIAREIAPESCLENSVLDHELKRIELNNAIAKGVQEKGKARIIDALSQVGIVYGNEKKLQSWLSGLVDSTIEPIIRQTEKELIVQHSDLDLIEESNYFVYVCDGQGFDIINNLSAKR